MNKVLMSICVSLWLGCGGQVTVGNESEMKTQPQGKSTGVQVVDQASEGQTVDTVEGMVIDPKSGIKFILIPAGSFNMGTHDGESHEKPIHPVTVKAFLMSETEVTVGQYRKCVEAKWCTKPRTDMKCTWEQSDAHPITCIDWGQARTFAMWVNGDLPTEAQWEYAARGGEHYRYAGAHEADEVGWYNGNAERAQKVKSKKVNGYGLYDMSGNVWEWILDEWHKDYGGAPDRAEQPWGDVGQCIQECDVESVKRVLRGGCWLVGAESFRVTFRRSINPKSSYDGLGFRVSKTLP